MPWEVSCCSSRFAAPMSPVTWDPRSASLARSAVDPLPEVPVDRLAEVSVDPLAELSVDVPWEVSCCSSRFPAPMSPVTWDPRSASLARSAVDPLPEVPVDPLAEVSVDPLAELSVDVPWEVSCCSSRFPAPMSPVTWDPRSASLARSAVDPLPEVPVDLLADVSVDPLADVGGRSAGGRFGRTAVGGAGLRDRPPPSLELGQPRAPAAGLRPGRRQLGRHRAPSAVAGLRDNRRRPDELGSAAAPGRPRRSRRRLRGPA